ncbi:zinc finger, CCHC-type containing protein [Tanacetum coccineum]
MHGMGKTVNELHAMLKLHEDTLPKKDGNPALHAIQVGRVQKDQKNKPHKAAKGGHGHWKKNCPVYLAELMKKKKLSQGASTLGALSLYMGDGHRAAVEAIRANHLELPSGLVIVLNNCHYAPSITRGVISVSKNNLVYFMAVPQDGIFKIDMSCSNTNDSSMYTISNKRAKINLDSTHLWHCRLGHIIKKHIEKLQQDGLINSIDIESLGKCVSCMSGKMARKPYSHQVERAKDLLGLIHTDSFWDYALETVARNLNMVPTKKVDKTPYEIWHGKAPKLS